jgi:hypothetical protein
VSVSVDPAMGRHPLVTLGPQLALDHGLSEPPGPEEQAFGLEDDLAVRYRSTSHDDNLSTRAKP